MVAVTAPTGSTAVKRCWIALTPARPPLTTNAASASESESVVETASAEAAETTGLAGSTAVERRWIALTLARPPFTHATGSESEPVAETAGADAAETTA